MTEEEQTFLDQARRMTQARTLATATIAEHGDRASSFLFSAAIFALEQTHGMEEGINIIRIWLESINAAENSGEVH